MRSSFLKPRGERIYADWKRFDQQSFWYRENFFSPLFSFSPNEKKIKTNSEKLLKGKKKRSFERKRRRGSGRIHLNEMIFWVTSSRDDLSGKLNSPTVSGVVVVMVRRSRQADKMLSRKPSFISRWEIFRVSNYNGFRTAMNVGDTSVLFLCHSSKQLFYQRWFLGHSR